MDAETLKEHQKQLSDADGKRIDLLDRVGVTKGWVVTTKVPEGFWDKCKTMAIPLKPKKGLLKSPATLGMFHWVVKYGKEIMFVLIPDEEAEHMHSGGPILLKDLDRDPNELLDESLASIGKDENLVDMKRRCAMMLLGWVDTK